jgi:hypothetical protein
MDRSLASKIFLVGALIVLIGTAYSMNRDYQDSWILEGLEIQFVLFVVTFVFAFYFEKSVSWRVALAVFARFVFILIPAVKYVWFQGPYIDETIQQALANYVLANGHVTISPAFSPFYSSSPLTHVFFSIFSLVVNVPIVDSMKYLPVLWSVLFPLLIFIIVKNMDFPAKSTLITYALFISAFPISNLQYIVTGSLLGNVFIQLILTILVLINVKTNRYFWPILVFSAIALAATHSFSSTIFSVFLVVLLFLNRFSRFGISSFLSTSRVLTLVFISLAWLVFQANASLQRIVQVLFVDLPNGATPVGEQIPSSFFQVLRISPLSAVRGFVVFFGADAFFLLLTFAGLILMWLMWKKLNLVSKFLAVSYSIIIILMVAGVFLKAGGPRLLEFAQLLFPIFSSVFVFSVLRKKTHIRKLIVGTVFFLIILLATVEFYGYQPLVPPANVLHKDLPPSVQSGYTGLVNSIYQRQMISFAEKFVSGRIATVYPITTQIVGLTNENFFSKIIDYNSMDKSLPQQQYDYFLINIPGPAGDYAGRTNPSLNDPIPIINYVLNQTIIYTNGESYVLANSP